jgi:hypothetical protein
MKPKEIEEDVDLELKDSTKPKKKKLPKPQRDPYEVYETKRHLSIDDLDLEELI